MPEMCLFGRPWCKGNVTYLPGYLSIRILMACAEYTLQGIRSYIREARRDPVTASNAFYAFGKYNALRFSPFGIEDFIRNTGNPDAALLETAD